jgi:hypothetical protein
MLDKPDFTNATIERIADNGYQDILNIESYPQNLQNEATEFLNILINMDKESIASLYFIEGIDSEHIASIIIKDFWENAMVDENITNEIVTNSWRGFLWDLEIMVERISWQIYKEIISKFESRESLDIAFDSSSIATYTINSPQGALKQLLSNNPNFYLVDKYGFDDRWDNIGSEYGSWNAFPYDYTQSCINSFSDISFGNIGSSLRLDYDVESENSDGTYNGFWMDLKGTSERGNYSKYEALVFFVRGDEIANYPQRIKIGLEDKENGTVKRSDIYITGIDESWRMVVISFDKLLKSGNLQDMTNLDTLSITFEKDMTEANLGTIYIDEIGFIKDISLLDNFISKK